MSCGFLGSVLHRELAILTRFYSIVWFSGSDWELHPIVIPVSPCLIIQGLAEHRCNATYASTITASVVVTHYTVRVYRGYIFRRGNTHVHITFTSNKSAVGEWLQGSIWVNACKIKRSIDIDDLQWLTYTWINKQLHTRARWFRWWSAHQSGTSKHGKSGTSKHGKSRYINRCKNHFLKNLKMAMADLQPATIPRESFCCLNALEMKVLAFWMERVKLLNTLAFKFDMSITTAAQPPKTKARFN